MKSQTGKDLETTPIQNVIYTLLVNPTNPKFPRTQSDVCNLLDMSKSTVNDNVRKLIEKGFLKEIETQGKIKLYRGGKYKKIIELRLPIDNLAYGAQFDTFGQAITPLDIAEPSAGAYRPLWRTHLNGGWLMFPVLQEGYLDRIAAAPDGSRTTSDGSPIEQELFGDVEPYHLKGSLNWAGSIIQDGNALDIRYQRTTSGKRFFYITPDNKICTAADVTSDADIASPFMRSCRPILQWLEKYGEWKFKHTDTGDYECVVNVKKTKMTKEYGADAFVTDLFNDYVGEDCGAIGVTPYHFDRSPRAQGKQGEWEFTRSDYVDAVDALPETKRSVAEILRHLAARDQEFAAIVSEMARLRDDLNFTLAIVRDLFKGEVHDFTRSPIKQPVEVVE